MSEARSVRDAGVVRFQSEIGQSPYEVVQAPDGRAAVRDSRAAVPAGQYGEYIAKDVFQCKKTAGISLLAGGRVYWDHSANEATYRKNNDRDFYLGRAVEDAGSSATTVLVELASDPRYDIDLARDAYITVPVGTQAVGSFGEPRANGGALIFELSSTNEAQKVDALSVEGFDPTANAIIEGAFRVISDGAGSTPDVSLGVASGTNATDADSIAESVFIHLNGNDVNIYAESDDGTTEVAATDTTINYTEGSALSSRVEFWLDMRNKTDVGVYINGVQVLTSTTFNVDVAAGPLYLLAHVEKTASTDTYKLALDWLRVRFSEQ